jgi:predicted DsbA family dithiol-disulfide isomerase
MELDVYADVVCPWCYIGNRRLHRALAAFDGPVHLRYRPFQLDPTPVAQPRPLIEAMAAKFGGRDRATAMFDRVTEVAAADGLELRFDRAVAANTFDAHRLIWFAGERGCADEVVEALYRAHFTEGADIGSPTVLAAVAAGVGLDGTEIRERLASDADVAEVRAAIAEAQAIGVRSVPTFVLAGRYAVTGAQDTRTLLAALTEVAERGDADQPTG